MVRKSNIICGSISMVVLLIEGQREITLCIPCYKCKPWQLTPQLMNILFQLMTCIDV